MLLIVRLVGPSVRYRSPAVIEVAHRFSSIIQEESVSKLLVGFLLAPPFVVAFSIGSFISPQVHKPVEDESGPMSGYFYRERADKKYRVLICAGLIAGLNLVLMIATSASD